MKAVFLDYQSLSPEDLDLTKVWNLPFDFERFDTTGYSETANRINNADIVLTNKVVLDKKLLSTNPQIKLVVILATGTNNVDLKVANSLGIPVCNISGYSTESVAQHTIACLLELSRRLHEYRTAVDKGKWSDSPFFCLPEYPIRDLAGQTMGIIGYGAIGKRVHELAEAFGMNVVISESLVPGTSEQAGRTPLTKLYRDSDVVSIHCPLSPHSKNLVDREVFSAMKENAILLNMARGGIVHENDLLDALKSGEIMAAATDVLTKEPPPENHVLLSEKLPNLLITPHVAWASRQSRQNLVDQVFEILNSFTNGNIINRVNN